MTVVREYGGKMGKNAAHILVVDVMKKTVQQNEIKSLIGRNGEARRIGHQELAMVTPLGVRDVTWIDIDPQVIRGFKESRVGSRAASNIEHSAHAAKIIVRQHGREFLILKRFLPQPVNRGLFHQASRKFIHARCRRSVVAWTPIQHNTAIMRSPAFAAIRDPNSKRGYRNPLLLYEAISANVPQMARSGWS